MSKGSTQTEFQQTASNAGLIGLAAFGGALVGFVLQLLVAYYFGAGDTTDAFFMAQSTSELLGKLLMGGSITAVFIPMFVERLVRGKKTDAWGLALNILHIMAAVYLVFVALLFLFAEPFVRFIAPGFTGETFDLTVRLLRVLLPSFCFLFLVELATSMLHSLRQFALPALLRIVAPLTSILTIILTVQALGIYSLALGVVIGSALQFTILSQGLRRQGLSYRFIFAPRDPAIVRLLQLVYPFIFSVLATQGAGIAYRMLVSDLDSGSLASLKFAEKITQLLTIMFLSSVTLVIYPLLSEKAGKKDSAGMHDTMASAIRLIFFVTIPLVIGVALLRDPLISFIYQRGSFSAEDAAMTSIALLFLVLGLTTNGISSVFGHAVLALQKTKAAVVVTICSQIVAISLFVLLVPLMQHAGLALASSLVPVSAALLYFLYLRRHVPNMFSIFVHRTYVKTAILAVALAAGIILSLSLVQGLALPSGVSSLASLIIPSIVGSIIFFGGAHLWNVQEMQEVLGIVQGKLTKWRRAA
ncbi:MAG: murein biosynthesis integral membrane protein MurJ [Candidatus Andersenbacteria bacterium]